MAGCGGQITNELVRQLLEQGGMYSLDKPIGDMRYITDTRCAPPVHVFTSRCRIHNELAEQCELQPTPCLTTPLKTASCSYKAAGQAHSCHVCRDKTHSKLLAKPCQGPRHVAAHAAVVVAEGIGIVRSFMAAMNIPGGGKNDIPNRLKRQFSLFHVPLPSPAAINNIFGALVQVSSLLCGADIRRMQDAHAAAVCCSFLAGLHTWQASSAYTRDQAVLHSADEGNWQLQASRWCVWVRRL